jgi:hypothetical protein
MSGSSIPYHLRPHKSVDRRLFLDLLGRIERWTPLLNYAYLSMGAYPLEDHKLIHRILGITRLIAFDFDEKIVARQVFNKPVDSCHCLHKKSDQLISELEAVLQECAMSDADGLIFWLDYTDPKKIGQQMREFESLLSKLRAGDLVRVTVNSHPNSLSDPQLSDAPPLLKTQKMEKQFLNLKNRIGDFLPSTASAEDMTLEGLPLVLAKSFGAAALKALPVSGTNTFVPLSIIRYADGEQMLSITGSVVAKSDVTAFQKRLDLQAWPFWSPDWAEIHRLVVPALTLRERLFLERGVLSKPPIELVSELGFDMASDIQINEFLNSYKHYYRFYPTILAAEL